MKQLMEEVLKRFQSSKAKYLKIDLGWRKHIEFEKREDGEVALYSSAAPVSIAAASSSGSASEKASGALEQGGLKVVSYYVGKFKSQKENLKGGEMVKKNEVLGTIESMGIIHEVLSPAKGILIEVNVKNEDIVEYEQVLFQLKEEK